MSNRMTKHQRIEKAIVRLEEAQSELLRIAYRLDTGEVDTWNGQQKTQQLMHQARAYANAIRSLSAASRLKA